jgi:hypothetical protein
VSFDAGEAKKNNWKKKGKGELDSELSLKE